MGQKEKLALNDIMMSVIVNGNVENELMKDQENALKSEALGKKLENQYVIGIVIEIESGKERGRGKGKGKERYEQEKKENLHLIVRHDTNIA